MRENAHAILFESSCMPIYERGKPYPTEPTLNSAIREFENKPLTPQSLTQYWRIRCECLGSRALLEKMKIPHCPYTQQEIDSLAENEKTIMYVPPNITFSNLASIHPEIKSSYWSDLPDQNMKNDAHYGWMDIDSSPIPQNTETSDRELEKIFKEKNRHGIHLLAYIIGALDIHDRTGSWLDHIKIDHRAYPDIIPCRLLGSNHTLHKLPFVACFYQWGELSFASYSAIGDKSFFGARSIGQKKPS